tara:strand:+ start:686 stop:1219 length:534 start_codon:yes stop_codon:yes gene_type:complete
MEQADDILKNMGISSGAPLSESSGDSINSVGKNYDNVALPDVTDEQRSELLAHSGFILESKKEEPKKEEGETEAACALPPLELKKGKTKADDDSLATSATQSRTLNLRKRTSRASYKASTSKVVGENTAVGMIGVGPLGNSPAADPDSPFTKKSKKKSKKKPKRRSTLKFIDLAFNK